MGNQIILLAASVGDGAISGTLAEPHSMLLMGVALGGILIGRFVLDRKQD